MFKFLIVISVFMFTWLFYGSITNQENSKEPITIKFSCSDDMCTDRYSRCAIDKPAYFYNGQIIKDGMPVDSLTEGAEFLLKCNCSGCGMVTEGSDNVENLGAYFLKTDDYLVDLDIWDQVDLKIKALENNQPYSITAMESVFSPEDEISIYFWYVTTDGKEGKVPVDI